jgi:hypothetical protein
MRRYSCFLLFVLLLIACGRVNIPALKDVPGTPTLPPTPSLPPTATSRCVPQPIAPAALQSAQERVEGLVPGARVTWVNEFDCNDLDTGWNVGSSNPQMQITDDEGGMVTISTELTPNVWDGIGRTTNSLQDNSGFLVLFRYAEGTSAPMFIMSGDFLTPSARRWGLDINPDTFGTNQWDGWDGVNSIGPVYIHDVLRPDTWFYLLIRLDDHGLVTLRLWEKDDPGNSAQSLQQMPDRWVGRQWGAVFQVYVGRLDIDEYMELSFDTP